MKNSLSTWRIFSAAPHRMMFFGGAVQGVAVMVWWLADLLGRYGGFYTPPAWPIPPMWAHGFLMLYGLFPFFIFGFLMTVYPNWMNGEPVPKRYTIPAFLLLSGGVLLFYLGLFTVRPVLVASVLALAAGWGLALFTLLRVLVTAPHPDKRHPVITTVALAMGWLGVVSYLLWLLTGEHSFVVFALRGGIWLFLLPILVTVSHRMIPFFSSRVLQNYRIVRPDWTLWAMLAGSAGHGLLEVAQLPGWLWLFDAPFLAAAAYLSYSWGLLRSFQVRLLAVLHIAFFWLSIGLALSLVQSLAAFVSGGATWILGLAPLHALMLGYAASMLLGMGARVTMGHSGQELVADGATWGLFLGFQLAAVARILGDLPLGLPSGQLYLLAALVWLAGFATWAVKYAPSYWRARIDGKPG